MNVGAVKRVDVVEYNPFEAVKTNVLGTRHVIETAIEVTEVIQTALRIFDTRNATAGLETAHITRL